MTYHLASFRLRSVGERSLRPETPSYGCERRTPSTVIVQLPLAGSRWGGPEVPVITPGIALGVAPLSAA